MSQKKERQINNGLVNRLGDCLYVTTQTIIINVWLIGKSEMKKFVVNVTNVWKFFEFKSFWEIKVTSGSVWNFKLIEDLISLIVLKNRLYIPLASICKNNSLRKTPTDIHDIRYKQMTCANFW